MAIRRHVSAEWLKTKDIENVSKTPRKKIKTYYLQGNNGREKIRTEFNGLRSPSAKKKKC